MKPQLKMEIAEQPKHDETEFIVQQLIQFNSRCAGDGNFRQLTVFLRDEDDNLVGGLVGSTYWQWLYVDVFWINETYRGGGCGTSLLAAAEQEAVKRGCQYAYLDTFSFQAPEFYQKLGYTVFGELPDFPEGHSRFFLKKVLQ
ncbi:GNAT family N-acetyltransferase [Gloeocapsopsis sp. IPPAS B-1203]|nr:GNAT family N-acetyltransferase [Gloeocapsopsis sp. IPPAS B-1203]